MEIRTIRHAEPAYVVDGTLYNDPPLTDRGRDQAKRLADREWGKVDEIWVSPMVRSQQTAEPLAERLGIAPRTIPWMREIAMPDEWDGSPAERLEDMFEQLNLRDIADLWEGVPGGESFRDFHVRVTEGLTGELRRFGARPVITGNVDDPLLWSEPDDVSILYVAHGGTNAVTLGFLLGMEPTPWEWDRFDSAHSSVATVRTKRVSHSIAFGMVGFGDVSHLDAVDVTR